MSQWGQWSSPSCPHLSPNPHFFQTHQSVSTTNRLVSQSPSGSAFVNEPLAISSVTIGGFCGNDHNGWVRRPNDDNVCVFFLLPSLIDMRSLAASRRREPPWQLCRPQIILDSFPSMLLLEFVRLTFSHYQEFWAFGFSYFSSKSTKHALKFVSYYMTMYPQCWTSPLTLLD